jgi:hypothetical protein
MSMKLPYRKVTLSGTLYFTVLSSLAFTIFSGCSSSEAAPLRSTSLSSTAINTGAKVDSDSYAIEMKATGPYKAGAEGTVEVTLTAKGDYHINKQYPYKFKLIDPAPDGVTFPKAILKKEDGAFDEKKATFKVPFVVTKAGKAKVSGTLSLSVCSDANCIMEKQLVEVSIDAK